VDIIRINSIYLNFKKGAMQMKNVLFSKGSTVGALVAAALAAGILTVGALLAASVNAADVDYSDVRAGHWAYEAVSAMRDAGVITGYPDGSFKPAGLVTYGEFIKMAYVAAVGEDPGAGDAGKDWARPYYDAALEADYFTGYDISPPVLGDAIPRGDAALILSRILGDAESFDSPALREKIGDVDVDTKNMYDILKVYAAGLITGYPDATFRPEGRLTRAEAATVIYRLVDADERVLPEYGEEEPALPAEPVVGMPVYPGEPHSILYSDKLAIERVDMSKPSQLLSVVESSVSKRPISEITDDVMFTVDDEPVLDSEFFEHYPYQMKTTLTRSGGEMLIVGYGGVTGHLIKDRKVIAEVTGSLSKPAGEGTTSVNDSYGEKFPDFDYIAYTGAESRVVLLIPKNM
jgi:hypothetical protein